MTFTSCSSDSDNGSGNGSGNTENQYSNPKEYVGKWELVSAETVNSGKDTTITYNGDHVMILKENGAGVDDISGFFSWRVNTENNKFEMNHGSLWLGTITTKSISESDWYFSEQVGNNQFLDSHYKRITNANPSELVGKWNIYKVLKKSASQTIDTLDSDWKGAEDVTASGNWYDKYMTFKADGTYIDNVGRGYEWFVTGPHIWTVGTECTDMVRVYTGVDADRISYVTYGDTHNTRFYLLRVLE